VKPAETVTVRDVLLARTRIGGILPATPTVTSRRKNALLKLENLQQTGAYKVRGALNFALWHRERGDARRLFAASAGNHAKGVAWAAKHTGTSATVVVPIGAPETKIEGALTLGAEVVVRGRTFEECLAHARVLALEHDGLFVHAFDDPLVIAGQGTIALELLDYRPDVVVVPIGGGGLAAGLGVVLAAHGIRVVGAQIDGVDAMRRALAGEAPPEDRATLADGLRVRAPGELTRRICASVLDDIVLVSEDEVRAAVVDLAVSDKIVAEGAGAVAFAALDHVHAVRPVAIVSGGNIDWDAFGRLGRAACPRVRNKVPVRCEPSR
jgi:threonine dehydratase